MKHVHLKQTHKPPSSHKKTSSRAQRGDLSAVLDDATDSKEIPDQVRDDEHFDYQGKRRDQVEKSYTIFVWSLLLSLIIALLSLIAHG